MTRRLLPCFVLLVISACCAEAAEVRLHSVASCPATIVRLADLAEIIAEDPEVIDELSAIPLFPAPRSGSGRQLDRHQVRQLLAVSGIDLKEISITGSEIVVIETNGQAAAIRPVKRDSAANSGVRLASLETIAHATKPAAASEPPPPLLLIERGDAVTVHSRGAGVRITTSGKAMGQGALGDEIAVELGDKKVRVLGRIAGPQLVEVSTQP